MTQAPTHASIASGPTARPAVPPLGEIGSWILARLVAEGPLARVYQARPSGTCDGRNAYAIKLLHRHWEDAPEAVALVRREAQVGSTVAHPHLVPVLAAHVASSPYYIVMPWLEGATLAQRLRGGRRPSLAVALWYVRQAAGALAALHDAGWIHGDVKPANLMVSPEGHVTLIDLGYSQQADETGSAVDRLVLGTVHYVAPERITSGLGVGITSDVYSLGATLFELITGRLPFEAADLADLVRMHRQEQPPAVRDLDPRVPHSVDRLVREMLARQPLRRPQTPCEVVDRLARLEIECFAARVA
jgi:serine/threonine protein kinase